MWTSNGNGLRLTQSMVEEEDINLLNRDVLTEVVDGLPLIQFLEKVQALIHKSMDKTIVIKLLGRQIGFNVLLNKINAL
ncbi:hypothetical protein Goari_024590, partial [Gossypium aridum]|nr:hypothetical protein [Gossypium aridum]